MKKIKILHKLRINNKFNKMNTIQMKEKKRLKIIVL